MKTRKSVTIEDDSDAEADAAFLEEEAKARAEQYEKEKEEQNKFDCLCDGVLNCLSLVDSSFSELLELKDELLQHDLPPSLLVSITLVAGKMFRSITDLHTPIKELTRLVNLYSIPWQERSESIKKLHNDYESKQRQLNIAIRKLQMVDAHTKRIDQEKRLMNWERAFAKVTGAKSHGRRWKFIIEAIKNKIKRGESISDVTTDLDDEESNEPDDTENMEQYDSVSDKQRFMMSVIAASPPADGETPQVGSDLESEGEGIPSELSDTTSPIDDTSPDGKRHSRGVSFEADDEQQPEIVIREVEVIKEVAPPKPETDDKSVWTHEPEYNRKLCVRLFHPFDLKGNNDNDFSCGVSFAKQNFKTAILPIGAQLNKERNVSDTSTTISDGKKSATKGKSRRKSIGFADKPSSPQPKQEKPSQQQKPSSILKKRKSDDDTDETDLSVESGDHESPLSEPGGIDLTKFEEVTFDIIEGEIHPLRIVLYENDNMTAMSTLEWPDLIDKNFTEFFSDGEITPENIPADQLTVLPLQGIKMGLGDGNQGLLGNLPVLCYWIKTEKPKHLEVEVNTSSVNQLVQELTGVDLSEMTKEALDEILHKDLRDMNTSAMSMASSSSNKTDLIRAEELENIKEQHDSEVKKIQEEYESKVQHLLAEVEKLQSYKTLPPDILNSNLANEESGVQFHVPNKLPAIASSKGTSETTKKSKHNKFPELPNWGAHLPKNVWVRMRLLTEEMVLKRQQLLSRIRYHVASNIEKKLASQYKLQRSENTLHGPLQDVTLPALFMPSKVGNVYNPRARMYFHPAGTSEDLRLTQPPSIFQLPPLPEKSKLSVVNLFELSKNFEAPNSSDWLNRIASAPCSRSSRGASRASAKYTPVQLV